MTRTEEASRCDAREGFGDRGRRGDAHEGFKDCGDAHEDFGDRGDALKRFTINPAQTGRYPTLIIRCK